MLRTEAVTIWCHVFFVYFFFEYSSMAQKMQSQMFWHFFLLLELLMRKFV